MFIQYLWDLHPLSPCLSLPLPRSLYSPGRACALLFCVSPVGVEPRPVALPCSKFEGSASYKLN